MADGADRSLTEAGYRLMPFLRLAASPGAGGDDLGERLRRAGYVAARPALTAQDIAEVLQAHPALIDAWLGYADAKASADGWYVTRDGEVGQVTRPAAQRTYAPIGAAVAQFLLREWDFQAGLDGGAAPARGRG